MPRQGGIRKTFEQTAIREVFEELLLGLGNCYLGKIHYTYKSSWENSVVKAVHWFLMQSKSMDSVPLKREGLLMQNLSILTKLLA